MNGYIVNIEQETVENTYYRKVLYTASNSQLVVMCLMPGEDIGEEVHELDQFIRIEEGEAVVVLNGIEHPLPKDHAVVIPEGTQHNIVNKGAVPVKLYSLYAPPEHKNGTIHATKQDARIHEEHFDGSTTE